MSSDTPRSDAAWDKSLQAPGNWNKAITLDRPPERELNAIKQERDDALKALQTHKHFARGEADCLRAENERLTQELAAITKNRDALRERVSEYEQDVADALADTCHDVGDEVHCSCVPALRAAIAQLTQERDALLTNHCKAASIDEARREAKLLAAENERLRDILREVSCQLPSCHLPAWSENSRINVMNKIRAALGEGQS